jgi:hypothetical protein
MRADPEAGYFLKERTRPDPDPHKIQNQIYKNHTRFKQTQAWEKYTNINNSKKVTPGSAGLFHSKNVSPSDPHVSVRIV